MRKNEMLSVRQKLLTLDVTLLKRIEASMADDVRIQAVRETQFHVGEVVFQTRNAMVNVRIMVDMLKI